MTPNAPPGSPGLARDLRLSLMTPWSRARLTALRRTSRPISMSSVSLTWRDEKHDDDREEPDQQGVGAPEQGQRSADIGSGSSAAAASHDGVLDFDPLIDILRQAFDRGTRDGRFIERLRVPADDMRYGLAARREALSFECDGDP